MWPRVGTFNIYTRNRNEKKKKKRIILIHPIRRILIKIENGMIKAQTEPNQTEMTQNKSNSNVSSKNAPYVFTSAALCFIVHREQQQHQFDAFHYTFKGQVVHIWNIFGKLKGCFTVHVFPFLFFFFRFFSVDVLSSVHFFSGRFI